MTNEEILRKFKRALAEEKIEDADNIVAILEEVLPLEIKKTITVDDIIKHAERIYQKKYGIDEIFVQYPISAKIRVDVDKFRKSFKLGYNEYKNFIVWLLECNEDRMNVYDLYNEKLYNKFKENYEEDKEIIKEKKKLNTKRIMTI